MMVEQHLVLHEFSLQPSEERLPRFNGWLMARVCEGFGYWLQHATPARELAVGDGFIVTSNTKGVLRASQLGPLKLQFFTVHPQHLTGIFTVAEWHQFEISPNNSLLTAVFFKAAESVGQKFARIAGLSHSDRLQMRCALLQFWAAATKLLPSQTTNSENDLKLRERFRQLVGQMSEVELDSSSPADFKKQPHHNERHFNRKLCEEFGIPLSPRQVEMQAQRVRQLLVDSNVTADTSPPETSAGDSTTLSNS